MNINDTLMRTVCDPIGSAPVMDIARAIARKGKHHFKDVEAQLRITYNVKNDIINGWSLK